MITALVGLKSHQSQAFTPEGIRIPVTVIRTTHLKVVRVKTQEKDGYEAVVLGVGTRRATTVSKGLVTQYKKIGFDKMVPRYLREVALTKGEAAELVLGSDVMISSVLAPGDKVTVVGVSKGKGFQGGVRRHGFKGGPRTHGQSDRERAPGSIGQTTTPGRVYKGKRMAGRMGSDQVTLKNLKVIAIDDATHTVTLKGLVPGGRNAVIEIRKG